MLNIRTLLFPCLLAMSLVCVSRADTGERSPSAALGLLDYIAVEYPQFVRDGQVLDANEYSEQVEFSARVASLLRELPENPRKAELLKESDSLAAAIAAKVEGSAVTEQAGRIKAALISAYGITVAPSVAPDLSRAKSLFSQRCAACHGEEGRGDGPSAAQLDPRPTNFHDAARHGRRSVQGLYSTITQGVDGTSMPAFTDLPEPDRWALAFHASRLLYPAPVIAQGKSLWERGIGKARFTDLDTLVLATPESVRTAAGEDGYAVLAFLRSEPRALAPPSASSPLERTRAHLQRSLAAYGEGNASQAYEFAISAYLDGFELAEAQIDSIDPPARTRLEGEMLAFRNAIRAGDPIDTLRQRHDRIADGLAQVERQLQAATPSARGQFFSSFVIIVREGLEALLVLAGMAAFLVRTGRRDGLRYLHGGWIAAIALGVLTWWVASRIIDVSGAQREVTEGVTALLASVVLLYVGFWLHSKSHGQRWSAFIRSQVSGALGRGTLWGLAAISFLAVYREVFETVLFYQALLTQGNTSPVLTGFAAGCAVLFALAFIIVRTSARLPLGIVFGASSFLLAAFAVVFAGRGVAALQAAGKLPVDPLSVPAVPWLGIYPNIQSIGLQVILVALIIAIFFNNARGRSA